MATSMADTDQDQGQGFDEAPLTPAQAAKLLNVSYRTVFSIIGLDWVEYPTVGAKRPIRRITPESVRRMLARRRGAQ
jgi:hypothetical protein